MGTRSSVHFYPRNKWNESASVMRAVCIRKRRDGRGSRARDKGKGFSRLRYFLSLPRKVAFITTCRSKDRTSTGGCCANTLQSCVAANLRTVLSRSRCRVIRVRTTSFRRRSRVDSSESIHPIVRPNNGRTRISAFGWRGCATLLKVAHCIEDYSSNPGLGENSGFQFFNPSLILFFNI